jgi:WD40 repeat protein
VAGNCDGALYYWNMNSKKFEKRVSGHEGPINCLKYNFMSGVLASADKEGNLVLWQ